MVWMGLGVLEEWLRDGPMVWCGDFSVRVIFEGTVKEGASWDTRRRRQVQVEELAERDVLPRTCNLQA